MSRYSPPSPNIYSSSPFGYATPIPAYNPSQYISSGAYGGNNMITVPRQISWKGVTITGKDKSKNPPGTKLSWKRLDEVYDPKTGRFIFRDSAPFTGQETDDAYRDYCFVINKKYEYQSPTCVTTIVIKSELLKDELAKIIGVIPPVSFHTPQVSVDPQILLTFYPSFVEHLKTTLPKSDPVHAQLTLLVDFLRKDYAAELERISAYIAHGEITFDLLWAILLPRKECYTLDARTGQPRLVVLKWASVTCGMGVYYSLDCEYIESFGNTPIMGEDESGKKFGKASYTGMIPSFQGAVKISSLRIFPLEFHPRKEEVRSLLIARGMKWAAHEGVHHKMYSGIAYRAQGRRIFINGRIMVDKATFRRINPNWAGIGIPLANPITDQWTSLEEFQSNEKPKNEIEVLTEDDFALASPIIYGFSLSEKLWVEFNIDQVHDIVWNDEAFVNLVLPEEKKSLIQALVEAHSKKKMQFDDFIEGKGQGLVMNLFGPPGVGKTMSAEATSEHLRKPLYVVGAGDLGTEPNRLDGALNEIFDIAHAWGAVVLIDEADVFLEERSVKDIDRNALVAVFLRQLEYFAGILFMTTNRVGTFDDAFQSRIHVALRYKELDIASRSAIWRAFLKKVGVVEGTLSEEEWELLASKPVNGRQIKNAVRTAQALALSRSEDLGYKQLAQVLDVMQQFEQDMKNLKT